MQFLWDDLNSIPMEDLFHPSDDPCNDSSLPPYAEQQPLSAGCALKEEMENYQEFYTSHLVSPIQRKPPDDLQPTLKFQFADDSEGFVQPFGSGSGEDLELCLGSDGLSGVTTKLESNSVVFAGNQSGVAYLPPFQMDGQTKEQAPVEKHAPSLTGKSRLKQKILKRGSKENNPGQETERHLAKSAAAPMSKEEDRRKRRKESNRRAAERYRTKLKTSAMDNASEHKRLADENDRLREQVEYYRRHLANVFDAIHIHQQQCSIPFVLPVAPMSTDRIQSTSSVDVEPEVPGTGQPEMFSDDVQDCSGYELDQPDAFQPGSVQFDDPDPEYVVFDGAVRCHGNAEQFQQPGSSLSSYPHVIVSDPNSNLAQASSFGHLEVIGYYMQGMN